MKQSVCLSIALLLLLCACAKAISPIRQAPPSTHTVPPSTTPWPGCERVEGRRQQACYSQSTGLRYWLSIPEREAGSGSERLPIILYLHGFSHSGSHLELVLNGGPALQVEYKRKIPALVISPQCPEGETWQSGEMVEGLSQLVDEVVDRYDGNPRKVYLTGFSMGGDGAWALGIAHPEQFAAVVPVGSWYSILERVCALKDVPVWIFQGEKDEIVSPEFAKNQAKTLDQCGGDVKLTLFSKAGHDESSLLAYRSDELYVWLLSQEGK